MGYALSMKIGTAISYVATPIAGAFGLPCVDPVTRGLRPDSTCAKVRNDLDAGRWRDAFYDFIWRKNGTEVTETTNMDKDWIIIHQMGVVAATPAEAIGKMNEAETIAVTVQLRQQAVPIRPTPHVMVPAESAPQPTKSAK